MANFIGIDLSGQCCKPIAIYDHQEEPDWMRPWRDTPEDIQQRLLHTLAALNPGFSAGKLGYPVDKEKAVIIAAVPASCNELQRRSLRAAAKAQGYRIKRFVGASAAAGIGSYWKTGSPATAGHFSEELRNFRKTGNDEDSLVLVCTMGECFEAAVLDCGSGILETCSQAWDPYLNEDSFRQRLANSLMGTVFRKTGVSVVPDSDTARKLRSLADSAVNALNENQETTTKLSGLQEIPEMAIPLSRDRFRELTADLGLRVQKVVRKALEEAGQAASALNQILLVGAAGMDVVRQAVAEAVGMDNFEKTAATAEEDSIARGAAYQAETAAGGFSLFYLMDAIPMSLGIACEDGKALTLVEKGSILPIHKVQTFTARERFNIALNVLEGEEAQAENNTCIDRYWLTGIPYEQEEVLFDIHFDIDTDGILSVTARDSETGVLLELRPTSGPWQNTRSFPVPAEKKAKSPEKAKPQAPKPPPVEDTEAVLTKFLPVYDNLERALNQKTADAAYKKGVELTMKELQKTFQSLGATFYGEVGEQFDPKLHNAVLHVESPRLGENVISKVLQKGVKYNGRILRHAMVQVAN